jgi:hypothetical protein
MIRKLILGTASVLALGIGGAALDFRRTPMTFQMRRLDLRTIG